MTCCLKVCDDDVTEKMWILECKVTYSSHSERILRFEYFV